MTIKLSSKITEAEKRQFEAGFNEGRDVTRQKAETIGLVLIAVLTLVWTIALGILACAVTYGDWSYWLYGSVAVLIWVAILMFGRVALSNA